MHVVRRNDRDLWLSLRRFRLLRSLVLATPLVPAALLVPARLPPAGLSAAATGQPDRPATCRIAVDQAGAPGWNTPPRKPARELATGTPGDTAVDPAFHAARRQAREAAGDPACGPPGELSDEPAACGRPAAQHAKARPKAGRPTPAILISPSRWPSIQPRRSAFRYLSEAHRRKAWRHWLRNLPILWALRVSQWIDGAGIPGFAQLGGCNG